MQDENDTFIRIGILTYLKYYFQYALNKIYKNILSKLVYIGNKAACFKFLNKMIKLLTFGNKKSNELPRQKCGPEVAFRVGASKEMYPKQTRKIQNIKTRNIIIIIQRYNPGMGHG